MVDNDKMTKNDIDRWIKLAEWRGEVTATLKGVHTELIGIKRSIGTLRDAITKVQLKVAATGATVSIVVTVIVLIIASFVRNKG